MKLALLPWLLAVVAPSLDATEVRVVQDIAYLGKPAGLKLDLYLPAPPPPGVTLPALVLMHGNNQTKSTARAIAYCMLLAEAGYVCASIDYTSPGRSPLAVRDCKNAVRWMRTNAATYRIDPQRIGAVGLSMGGLLAITLGLTDGRKDLEPAQPYPGVSSAVGAVVDMFGVPPPHGYIHANAAPVLLIHGTADDRVPHTHSVDLAAALRARGVKHRLVLVPDAPHGFNLTPGPDNPIPIDLRPIVLDFLRENLAPRPKD